MDINKVLCYLTEELKDIPAIPKNTHYTDYEGLYYILQEGLKGQLGGYTIKANKTKKDDMELATTRNTHKLTFKEKMGLSSGATGGVRINLFTDRILAGHRGTRKEAIAELPRQSEIYMKQSQDEFKKKYDFEIPDFTTGPNHNLPKKFSEDFVSDWLFKNNKKYVNNHVVHDIMYYNRTVYEHYKELREREREERFILKKGIPVKPEFMEIVLEHLPEEMSSDEDFCEEMAANYLKIIDRRKDVFVQNKNFRDFKNYLRKFI